VSLGLSNLSSVVGQVEVVHGVLGDVVVEGGGDEVFKVEFESLGGADHSSGSKSGSHFSLFNNKL